MKKARIYKANGEWILDVPGVGLWFAPEFAGIVLRFRGFLRWANA